MGTGQMLVTIGAIMLLGTIILTTNRGISNSSEVLLKTSFGLEEVSLATTYIQRANDLAFDENDKNGTLITLPSQLTAAASLGYENNDPADLDDVDDLNGKPGVADGFRLDSVDLATGKYYVKTQVHYVSLSNLDPPTWPTSPTFHKRLDVWVWNSVNGPSERLHMSSILSYWGF